jgi:hypothetical protein
LNGLFGATSESEAFLIVFQQVHERKRQFGETNDANRVAALK